MKLLKWWKQEERADTSEKVTDSDTNVSADLLKSLMGNTEITRSQALEIPDIKGAINKIAGTVSALPVKL
ncbi:MAG: hypothetical protein SPF70_07175, partial [Lachnospiraceae bacterium]|nr:hypothetical protein [Lachnospiraceae bacterium]